MSDKYFTINLRAYLDKDEPTYVGEESLNDLLSDFSCPKNPDVEYFLLHNAIEFTKKDQSITYLVFNAETASLVGYFSLAIKPICVQAANISKTVAKKISRVSVLDDETDSYTTAAYLIAQLGKNYSLPKEERIEGTILLGFALETIANLKYSVGGVMEFLECEDSEFLLNFYTKNHFKPFDIRITVPAHGEEPRQLHQLLKFI
ncbi:MAG: GNAT family acetyltransferase [Lachnospiraceae bacterium]|nr:GNAT family acetyltransferase [Lachnospiraceae bacterium]